MEETLDVTILLSSLKKVIETNDKINSDILKNTLTKITFKSDKISFDQLNEIKRDLEDIFKTAESFVASLRVINKEENEEEEIILEAPEEFRNGNEPKRSETYREEGNNDQRQPEVTLLYTQEEVSCENQTQNTFTNDNVTQKESGDKDENVSNERYRNDKNNDKITRDGCVISSVDKVGVVAKPDCYYRLNELLLRPSPIHQYVLSGSRSTNIVSIETNEDETGVANCARNNSEFNNFNQKECTEEEALKDIEMSRISSNEDILEEKKSVKCDMTDVELPPPLNVLIQESFLNPFSSESKVEEIKATESKSVELPPPLDLVTQESFLSPSKTEVNGMSVDDFLKENGRKFREYESTGVELPPPLDLLIQETYLHPLCLERNGLEGEPNKSLLDLINLKIDECNLGAILENDLNVLDELNLETIRVDNNETENEEILINNMSSTIIEETSLLENLDVLNQDENEKFTEINDNCNQCGNEKRFFDIEGNEIYFNVLQEKNLSMEDSILDKNDSLSEELPTNCDGNVKDEDNIPIKITTETTKSPRIFDLPIIGNHNYSNSIISKIALEQSQNKLDELLKMPKNNRKDKKNNLNNLNNNNSSDALNLKQNQENQNEYLNEEKIADAKEDIVNIEKINKCINLDDTITKLNLEMQRSAEIDESLQLKEEGDACDAQRSIDAAASTCVRCAHADQCSCLPATEEDRAPRQHNNRLHRDHNLSETKSEEHNNLTWSFKNGRLVFEDVVADDEETSGPSILTSKNVNPKNNNEKGRLKILEEKLKEAGITDGKNELICLKGDKEEDIGNSIVTSSSSDEEEDFFPSDSEDVTFCEFNSQKPIIFFYNENDELEEEDYEEIFIMRGDNGHQNAEQQQQRKLHNPDKENLKSLLKKPGGKNTKEHQQTQSTTKKNRVVFNETKNEFFDADYIILIREECEYDEEEDDGVCTCNQHEMVRLTCCEPNCNCNVYGDGYDTTPPSPKFAPPLEFVDAVTLSPPEEYKDMELEEQQLIALQQQIALRGQRGAVCRECSASHDDDGESLSDNEEIVETPSDEQIRDVEGKEKTDQSQQTTPTTPPAEEINDEGQRYILETVTMTTVSERQIMKEAEEKSQSPSPAPSITPSVPPSGSPISGILKGGRLWKQTSTENNTITNLNKNQDLHQSENITSDDEGTNKRSVRFIESKENQTTPKQRDVCDGAPDVQVQEEIAHQKPDETKESSVISQNPNESTEMMLTFKLGNHVLISNNSLKPNSAVRQLFPCTKPPGKVEETVNNQYLVTAESLKAFEEAKRSKLPQIIQSGDTDESIRRAIERNTLRRSLIRGDPKNKKLTQKTDNSLVERIKQLTCDVDDSEIVTNVVDELQQQQRASPPGEEARNSPEVNANKHMGHVDKSFSPSSSSTASSNSSMSSTYKKITDLFSKTKPDIQNIDTKLHLTAPDLGNGTRNEEFVQDTNSLKINPATESRKQFLSTLVPLTACVSGIGLNEDYYHINNGPEVIGDRTSMASSVGTEYSLEDIDEVLRKDEEESCKKIAPDVIAGTPSASESGDELAMFVQQDAGRIERIKKKYQPETTEEDDEHDDYGFNRRPSVRGIKPRFGSTTEILQQIQNQMQPPNNTPPRNQNQQVIWPYYSEANVEMKRNPQVNYPIYPNQINNDDKRAAAYVQYSTPSRPSSYIEENLYQNCTNQRCTQINYRNMNVVYPSSVVRIGRNSRPLSPPPQEVSKNYHQTMVYIPYNHIEGYQHNYYNTPKECYARVSNQNQINKRYIEAYRVEDHYSKPILRQQQVVYQQRSESPQFHQSTARSTQTPSVVSSSNYSIYPQRYATRPLPSNGMVYQDGGVYPKINRHSYPRYPPSSDSLSLTDSDSQHSKCSMPNSPTKTNSTRFTERGVPEGAASVSPQDCGQMNNSSTMTSPTSPQNPQKPMFYAMNV
nr:uncharacterized protein LOC111424825 [Onthophagus taurus]XP_022914287.1 uncharacterized protein LOC111424825 [Onthophagus taurus]